MNVLVVHIGPVQEFIESARKCRDLWFGSWLLSELARSAARSIIDAEGRSELDVLVFPGASVTDRQRAVANRIVARVEGDPATVANAAQDGMVTRLREVRDQAFRRVGRGHPRRAELFKIERAEQQVEALMEFLWAAARLDGREYREALDEADRLLAAVKNTKVWEQPPWAEAGVPKSTLDGVRESVLDERLFDRPRGSVRQQLAADERRRQAFGIHGQERLCGVGLLKRFGNDDRHNRGDDLARIYSTSHVASAAFRAGLARLEGGRAAWDELCQALDEIEPGLLWRLDVLPDRDKADPITERVDGSVFYEGRLVEALEEQGLDPGRDRERFESAQRALRRFLGRTHRLGEPLPYYAVLLADGDRMGETITKVAERGFEAHRKLSEALEAFAASTRRVVEDRHGALIYAGGDDVLALVPLHQLLPIVTTLAEGFARQMKGWENDGQQPTLSLGVAIVHHIVPLDDTLRLVRRTERRAKDVPGKDALAIVVKKRGGAPVEVAAPRAALVDRLEQLVTLHKEQALSVKAQHELMELDARLPALAGEPQELAQVRQAESRRILARKRAARGKQDLAESTLERLATMGAYRDPARLGRELYVAQLVARACQQAEAVSVEGQP